MKKFLLRVFFFCIPGIILLAPPAIVLIISGENYWNIDNVIKKKKKVLIGYAYNENNYKYLQWANVTTKQRVEVLALGSSRILQLRKEMFNSSFYNAGYTIGNISEFIQFLNSIGEEKLPKVLVINLDQWMFNKNWDQLNQDYSNSFKWKNSYTKYATVSTLNQVWIDLFKGKYSIAKIIESTRDSNIQKIGLNAVLNNKGFRNDGSMLYGDQIIKLMVNDTSAYDFNYSETFLRIQNENRRFESGNEVSKNAVIKLEELLNFCRSKNIYVVAILPPFANKVNEYLDINGKHSYMNKIYDHIKPIFNEYGFELWEMSHLTKYNSGDHETLDGFHGGEVTYLKLLIYMLENESKLNEYTTLRKLKIDLANRKNNFTVYNE